ncbi:MAG: hypothetical protein M1839_004974 [Geoglossum umbratile]|nr:MAG: hypothetical protein M1839_004974 [Geoglossum umbratile]
MDADEPLDPPPSTLSIIFRRIFVIFFFAGLILTFGLFQSAFIITLIEAAEEETDWETFGDYVVRLLASSMMVLI